MPGPLDATVDAGVGVVIATTSPAATETEAGRSELSHCAAKAVVASMEPAIPMVIQR